MSKASDTKPILSKREEKVVRPVDEREYTMSGRLQKFALKTIVFLLLLSLGFILSELRFIGQAAQTVQTNQMDNSHQFAYVYDTEQKISDFYKVFESDFSEETGLPTESPEVQNFMTKVRDRLGRPLAAVGPFAVFVDDDGEFSVHEVQSLKQEKGLLMPLVELKTSEQSKRLRFYSSQEKGIKLPRFNAQFIYSGDGTYEKGRYAVHREEDGALQRMYLDRQGIGVFDEMIIFEHEHGVRFIYSLNNLTWELVDTQRYSEEEKFRVDGLLKDYNSLSRP